MCSSRGNTWVQTRNTPPVTTPIDTTTAHSQPVATRYHAFDAIRGAAMSFGVVLHGAVAYMALPMPGLVWPIEESTTSRIVDWLFWWIHGFRIPLFFVVAGFFAVMLHNSRGGLEYIRHRTKRILYPFLVACITILPLVGAAWVYGWLDSNAYTWEQISHLDFGSEEVNDNAAGLAHLWFLEYLYIYCVAFWLWRAIVSKTGAPWRRSDRLNRIARSLFASPLRPIVFALPAFAVLAVETDTIIDFKNSYAPTPMELLYNFLFFLIGTWLYAFRDRLGELKSFSRIYLLGSLIAAVPMVLLIESEIAVGLSAARQLILAALIATFCWLSIFAWIGLFLRWFDRHQPVVRWLSDSSYWVYLIHLPTVVVLQVWMTHVQAPAMLKFAVVLVIGYAICLMTYQLFVRYTAIGVLLNGPRGKARPPRKPSSDGIAKADVPDNRIAAADTVGRTR